VTTNGKIWYKLGRF